MIDKEYEGSINNNSLKKIRLNWREYGWDDSGDLIRNDGPTMLYLLFKITNPYKRIGVSNLKYKIDKSNLEKFGNNVKYIFDEIYYNCNINIDKGERHEDYVSHIFRDIL